MNIQEIKDKYPLAVDALKGGKYYYDQQSQMIFGEENGMVCEVMDIRGWGWIQKLTEPETIQDQIGEMLAEFLNTLNQVK
jgi:hypothetical protein